jgi:hypothetical protein
MVVGSVEVLPWEIWTIGPQRIVVRGEREPWGNPNTSNTDIGDTTITINLSLGKRKPPPFIS